MDDYSERKVHTLMVFDMETGNILRDEFYLYKGSWELFDRSAQGEAKQAQATAGALGRSYGQQAQTERETLVPTLRSDITNPTGFTPTETNAMLVAGEQGAGGGGAAITGQAGLEAARTRNTGSSAGILDQAARRTAQTLSQNALGVQAENARLAQEKRASALGGLEGLYGTDVGAQLKSMGIQNDDINTQIEAGKSGWVQNAIGGIGAIAGARQAFKGGK